MGIPARHNLNSITMGGAISTCVAHTRTKKGPRHANWPKIKSFGTFSTHLDQRFLNTCPDFRSVTGHSVAANASGLMYPDDDAADHYYGLLTDGLQRISSHWGAQRTFG